MTRPRTAQRFGLRLAGTLLLTMTVVGAAQYALAGAALTDRVLQQHLDGQRADAEVARALHDPAAADPLAQVRGLLGHVASRPGVQATALVGPDGHPAATGARGHHATGAVGRDAEGHGAPAAAAPHAAREADLVDRAARQVLDRGRPEAVRVDGAVVHAVPVDLADARHVLVVVRSAAALDAQVATVRWVLLVGLALGALVALPLFHLVGGRALAARHRQAVDGALRDGLTGLGNHRGFHEDLGERVRGEDSARGALVLVDLDGFKQVNDGAGHRRGDEVLAAVGGVLRALEPEVRAYRVGGDEFALLLAVPPARAAELGERVRSAVAGLGLGVTASAGVAALVPGAPGATFEAADAALYAAKRGGRDRVVREPALPALL